jgi:hypothetical protein
MISADVSLDLTVFDQITNHVGKTPKLMDTAVKLELRRFKPRLVAKFEPLPARHAGKFIWSLDKQANERARRWWFANRKGQGAYQRRGKNGGLVSQFDLQTNIASANGFITIINKAKGAKYVFGDSQIPSHRLTGHPRLNVAAAELGVELSTRLGKLWLTVADPLAGVR